MNFRFSNATAASAVVAVTTSAAAVALTAFTILGGPTAVFAQAQQGQIIAQVDIRGVKNTNPEVVRSVVTAAGTARGTTLSTSGTDRCS